MFTRGCEIKTFYLKSKAVFEMIERCFIINKVDTLYIGKEVFGEDFTIKGFKRTECREKDFSRFERSEQENVFADMTIGQIEDPDESFDKFVKADDASLMGRVILLKHRNVKSPFNCFVEYEKTVGDDNKTIDHLEISVHSGVSYKIDGTLIEDIGDAEKVYEKRKRMIICVDDWTDCTECDSCIIRFNGKEHNCKITQMFYASDEIKDWSCELPVFSIEYVENGVTRYASGLDIEEIVIRFDDLTEKHISRDY